MNNSNSLHFLDTGIIYGLPEWTTFFPSVYLRKLVFVGIVYFFFACIDVTTFFCPWIKHTLKAGVQAKLRIMQRTSPHPMGELDNFIFLFHFWNEKNVFLFKSLKYCRVKYSRSNSFSTLRYIESNPLHD